MNPTPHQRAQKVTETFLSASGKNLEAIIATAIQEAQDAAFERAAQEARSWKAVYQHYYEGSKKVPGDDGKDCVIRMLAAADIISSIEALKSKEVRL